MSARLEPCVPIDFDEKTLEDVVSKAKDWAVMHGLISITNGLKYRCVN